MNNIDRFREALKIPTFWPAGTPAGDKTAEAVLQRFQEFLAESYPAFHKAAERWVLSPYSVVYRWPGESTADAAKNSDRLPVLFLAHYDVVGAETGKWSVDPFGAEIRDGFIYGRGSLDMKNILIGIMEAAETLCAGGFKPRRDIWFAFGGDEERTGVLGAVETVKWFTQRGQRFEWLIDEGTPIGDNLIKGINPPLALISIDEKGYLSLELSVTQEPGHSSMPPKTQAAAVLGKALDRIGNRLFPFSLSPAVESFFKHLAPLMPGIKEFVMLHARSLGPLFYKIAGANPTIAAMLRTTMAMTQLEGSSAENVLPSKVRAILNLRLIPPWTVETAMDFVKKAVNDERVNVKVHSMSGDPVSAKQGLQHSGWKQIEAVVTELWPGVPVLPFVMVATTDSRHYFELAEGIYRFSPYKINQKDLSGIHGHDERISEENLLKGIQFYTRLMETS